MESLCLFFRDYIMDSAKRNVQRDAEKKSELESMGWTVVMIWECGWMKPRGKLR